MRQLAIVERNQFWLRRPKPEANFAVPISFCKNCAVIILTIKFQDDRTLDGGLFDFAYSWATAAAAR